MVTRDNPNNKHARNAAAADPVTTAPKWGGLEVISIMARFIDDHKKPFDDGEELVKGVDAYVESPNQETAGWVTLKYGGPMNQWDVSKVKSFRKIFSTKRNKRMVEFNKDIRHWDVSGGTDFSCMFDGASKFDRADLSEWNVSAATNMSFMFRGASSFHSDLSKWNVSKVTYMAFMFEGASAFHSDLSKWDVSKVTGMSHMFSDAVSFNADLSQWDVSKVRNMSFMFCGAITFQSSIGTWNVSHVKDMCYMFYLATAFDCDLSEWDVSNVRPCYSCALEYDRRRKARVQSQQEQQVHV